MANANAVTKIDVNSITKEELEAIVAGRVAKAKVQAEKKEIVVAHKIEVFSIKATAFPIGIATGLWAGTFGRISFGNDDDLTIG